MNATSLFRSSPLLVASLLGLASVIRADDESSVLTSVYAKTAKDYQRVRASDGKWEREYYAMVNGGPVEGTIKDNAQNRVPFVAVATVMAQHLARQRYMPATDPAQVDLLLVVNWGQTMPFSDNVYRENVDNVMASMNQFGTKNALAQAARERVGSDPDSGLKNLTGSVEEMEAQAAESYLENDMIIQDMLNRSRNQSNARTAHLLGYMGDINQADGPQRYAGGNLYNDLIADIEEARYYIILTAYDFQSTVHGKKPKIRWVTRMSMRAPGNSFAEKAAAMIAYSASRFGQDTDGLERKLYPQYKVNLEDVRFLGMAPEWKNPGAEPGSAEKQ